MGGGGGGGQSTGIGGLSGAFGSGSPQGIYAQNPNAYYQGQGISSIYKG